MEKEFYVKVLMSMRWKTAVTVGIGTLCAWGGSSEAFIILAVDKKASYSNQKVVPHTNCSKFHDLFPDPYCVSISGMISVCEAVVSELGQRLKNRKDSRDDKLLYPEDFRIAIREARKHEYGQFLNDELQGYLNISMSEWMSNTDKEIRRKGFLVARAARLYFPVFLIIGGFTLGNPMVLRSSGASITEMGAGPYAVGIGQLEATNQLNLRQQTHFMSAHRTLVHIDEAMEKARLAHPKSIGWPSDYIVIRRSGQIMRFPQSSKALLEWRKRFNGKDTREMDKDKDFRDSFEKELIPHISPNS